MILSSHVPSTSIPPAKSSWKTTTVDDVVALIKLAEGRDPAWRFLEIRQIDEIQRNVGRVVSAPDREAALQDQKTKLPSIREAIGNAAARGTPLFAAEMCVAQTARERHALWESGKAKKFEETPIALRVLLNVRNRQGHRRLLDTTHSACAKLLTDCIRISKSKGWILDDDSGVPKISETARSAVVGAFKASMVRPTGTEGFAKAINFPATDFTKVGEAVLKLAQDDLSFAFGARTKSTTSTNRSSGVSTKIPILEHALEILQRSSDVRPTRQQMIQAATVGLQVLDDPSVKDTELPSILTREVAKLCFPPNGTDGQAKTAENCLAALTPFLRNLSRGHEGMLQSMLAYAERNFSENPGHEYRLPVLQREALALAGHWLTRTDLPTELREPVKRILLKGASPYSPRLSAEAAMHWVILNQESFSSKELEKATLAILEHHDRFYLYHSLYISAESARREGRLESKGALEAVRDLVKGGRLGVEEASNAYRSAGLYMVRREREPGNGLWSGQRAETTAIMSELNELCGGEPERRWGAELKRLAEARRTTRNKDAVDARHRKERILNVAGNFIARQTKR